MNNRMVEIQNALRLIQFELDIMNDHNVNIQGYLSPIANEIAMSFIVQPYYNNLLNILINNNISYTEHCIQIERINRVIVNYVIKFNIEPIAQLIL